MHSLSSSGSSSSSSVYNIHMSSPTSTLSIDNTEDGDEDHPQGNMCGMLRWRSRGIFGKWSSKQYFTIQDGTLYRFKSQKVSKHSLRAWVYFPKINILFLFDK